MSISGSLSNALSGLNAASRAAEVVSSNVSNALTEGYGRREIDLASRNLGGNGAGVSVTGTRRMVDEQVISQRRLADAALGQADTAAKFLSDLAGTIGLPDDPASLTGRVTQLETSLIEAASRPDSQPRLQAVLQAAKSVAAKLNDASERIQHLRLEADKSILRQVETLNQSLKRVAKLNGAIRGQLSSGNDASALMDLRQQTIDGISSIIPLRQLDRGNGQVALLTQGGAILLDGKAAEVGFAAVNTIVPQMTIESLALSGLTINGQPISVQGNGPLGGGSLAGLFQVRDNYATTAQQRLDGVARDLIERFADPAVDPTLAATDPGLFGDAGAAFNSATELGLAGRLSVNALADDTAGGAVWRLRDGLGAATPGDVGTATLLNAMGNALRFDRIPASGGFSGAARSAVGLAGDLVSLTNIELRAAESDTAFATAQVDTLKTTELRNGVDTDQELQQLLLVEQAYSANAKVISTIDQMIQTLLGL